MIRLERPVTGRARWDRQEHHPHFVARDILNDAHPKRSITRLNCLEIEQTGTLSPFLRSACTAEQRSDSVGERHPAKALAMSARGIMPRQAIHQFLSGVTKRGFTVLVIPSI